MDKEKRIQEIDKEIADIEKRKAEWQDNDNFGLHLSFILDHDIAKLQLEKGDLLNGTHNFKIYQLEREISMLKMLKEQALFVGKISYGIKIKNAERELESYKNKRK